MSLHDMGLWPWAERRGVSFKMLTPRVAHVSMLNVLPRRHPPRGKFGSGTARMANPSIVYQLPWAPKRVKNGPGCVRMAKALIVYQLQGEGRDTLWREWRMTVLLGKALIVDQVQGGGGDPQWREWANWSLPRRVGPHPTLSRRERGMDVSAICGSTSATRRGRRAC